MPNIFGSTPGKVIAIESGDDTAPIGLEIAGFKGFLGTKALLTGMSVSGQSGYQVMHTLRQYIYIYTFGERVGDIVITGLAFVMDCKQQQLLNDTGLARLYKWYEANRISSIGTSISITLTPGLVFNAFLVDFKYQVEDPSIGLAQFALHLIYPPKIIPRQTALQLQQTLSVTDNQVPIISLPQLKTVNLFHP